MWENWATAAKRITGANAVEEADLPVEAPVTATMCVSTETLAFSRFRDVEDMDDLGLGLTSCVSELWAASVGNQRGLWAGDGEVAIWRFFAGGADVAPGEKEAVGRLAAELGEHEEVAVGSKTALLLAVELRP